MRERFFAPHTEPTSLVDPPPPWVDAGRDAQMPMWTALIALDGEVRKLSDMLKRDGRLWEHAADNLPRLAAAVHAAVTRQDPT